MCYWKKNLDDGKILSSYSPEQRMQLGILLPRAMRSNDNTLTFIDVRKMHLYVGMLTWFDDNRIKVVFVVSKHNNARDGEKHGCSSAWLILS